MMRCVRGCLALVGALMAAQRVEAQGTCEVNNQASCIVAGSATQALFITVTKAAKIDVPIGNIVLPVPESTALSTGFGVPVLASVTVSSNVPWSVAVNAAATIWTATPGTARQTKPAVDLQWGLSAGGAFSSFTAAPVTVTTGVAGGGLIVPLYLRVRYDFGLDRAGSYSLPLSIVFTAP